MSAAPPRMRVIEITSPGGPEVLRLAERPTPSPAPGEVLIRVQAAGLNRGDVVQRQGLYPPPPGVTAVPGLEIAGEIVALGDDVCGWAVGQPVCALLAGGGYAEYAVAPAGQCLPLPPGLAAAEGAALPEALFTCWTTLVDDGRLAAGETLLVHGGASGIGMTAIPLAKALGARVFVTAGSERRCDACRAAGADLAIDYKAEDFVAAVGRATEGRGVDVVLDMVAGDYVARSLQVLAPRGRHVTIGVMGGQHAATIPMNLVLTRRLVLTGSTLRGRGLAEKQAIRDRLLAFAWPLVADGRLPARVHARFPLAQAAEAHRALEAGEQIGKIVLLV